MRHAKSSWADASLADFDRPLNERGLRTAPFMGAIMRQRGLLPSVVISSPAARAITTACLVVEAAGLNPQVYRDDRIYEASPLNLLEVVSEIGEEHVSAMLVGHNPGMEDFVRLLTDEMQPMPTASLAVIELSVDKWFKTAKDRGTVREILRPKELL